MTEANGARKTIDVPLNRVEGDLEVRVELAGGHVTDTWSAGIMYRGIENLLKGRGARDGLVITPRICGICGTAHLFAAVKALEAVAGVTPPRNALLVRNLALMVEHVQSDVRHGLLMFMPDFANPAYAGADFYAGALERYAPFQGSSVVEAVIETKRLIEIIALLGGQWPHSTYMVPGGVSSSPTLGVISQCRLLLNSFRQWYERRILGCTLERWLAVDSRAALDAWLEADPAHAGGDLAHFIRLCRSTGLDGWGQGHGNFISYGQFEIPDRSQVRSLVEGGREVFPGGFARGTAVQPFDPAQVTEHVAYSWYVDYPGGKHPSEGVTEPYPAGPESEKYSWAKAPRYDGLPAETGPLAEQVIAGNPLLCELVAADGPTVFSRELARLTRPAVLLGVMEAWLAELDPAEPFYTSVREIPDGRGAGLSGGTRGALGHWIEVFDNHIVHYQVITPTAWNGSPRDANGVRGPWEEALVGIPVRDPDNPVELGHVIRSFDACLVCTVHGIGGSANRYRIQV